MSLQEENERLRKQLDEFRRKEVHDLQKRLDDALESVDHFRAEAERNAEVGRQIATQAQQEIAELKAKLNANQSARAHARRFS